MRPLTRPVLALITTATLTPGVCACGQLPAPGDPSSSSLPTTTTSAPAQPPAAAAPSLDEVYAKAFAAVEDAQSVHLRMTNKNGSHTLTLDVRGRLDGTRERQSFRDSDGSVATTILVGEAVYLRANESYWRNHFPGIDTSGLPGRWVALTGDVPVAFLTPVLRTMVLTGLDDWAPGTVRHQVAQVSVRSIDGIRCYQVDVGSAINALVVDARTSLPTSLTVLDPDAGATTVVLTSWGGVETITAPTDHATLRLDTDRATSQSRPAPDPAARPPFR